MSPSWCENECVFVSSELGVFYYRERDYIERESKKQDYREYSENFLKIIANILRQ